MSRKFRYIGKHPLEITIGEKKPMVAMGEYVDLGDEDLNEIYNKDLIDRRLLIEVKDTEKVVSDG